MLRFVTNDHGLENISSQFLQHYYHAPYFDEHSPFFKDMYSRRWKLLADLNVETIQYLGETLGMGKNFIRQSSLGIEGQGTDLLVALCRAVGADTYLA